MKTTSLLKLSLIIPALQCTNLLSLKADTFTNLVGDMDQNPPPNPDGHDIVHEVDDLPGFDQRQVGGTVTWIHNVSTALGGQSIATATLRVAVVGLIDQNFPGIDNYLFVNGVEVLGAFDNSHDGWRLYEFPLNPAAITNGILVVELRASEVDPKRWTKKQGS